MICYYSVNRIAVTTSGGLNKSKGIKTKSKTDVPNSRHVTIADTSKYIYCGGSSMTQYRKESTGKILVVNKGTGCEVGLRLEDPAALVG